ncbi:LacI family DNA-binding transcriptional regulator [Catenulispora sp. NF23]|uniref:LacI family DNA-binding transcriptional regulator n=1 Tax=Catenulispora pinistramenti TaxID=2705254 RepID=A0ABS5L614_9ACTN|nr:LacI family DNA-binding transcriptional regulator [Catenulispora pinistramenti]MBS2553793.1 LacI family DNA-binding transcriptional regulator [Catenulispora pinistramenti]
MVAMTENTALPATARLADIAAHAKVSEATVSRVLNGKAGVAAATRQAVLAALDVMGYERPTRLRQRSAALIGLIIPELDNPIFPAMAQAVERALTHHGYTPVLATVSPGGATEDDLVELLLEHGVAGIVFASGLHADTTASRDRYHRLSDRGVPFVLINGYAEGVAAPFISPDDALAARLSVTHLADLGHERIGLAVGPKRYVPVIRKIAGFTAALRDTLGEQSPADFVEYSLYGFEGGRAAAAKLLDRGCTGIVCASDMMALGAIAEVRARGMAVPGDISVVGYDDSPLIPYTDPPLTTVRQPVAAMGAAAVRALLEEVGGGHAPRTEFVFAPELVVRGSTGSGPRVRR